MGFVCSTRHYELTGQLPYRSLSKNDRDFLGAKREYMIGMMDHIDKQYGGVFEYLDAESLGHYLGMSFERNEKGIRKGSVIE